MLNCSNTNSYVANWKYKTLRHIIHSNALQILLQNFQVKIQFRITYSGRHLKYNLLFSPLHEKSVTVHLLTVKMSFRVRKKNFNPDKATVSLTTSSEKRYASLHHDCFGIARNTLIDFFDSSWMYDANSETATVLEILYQKKLLFFSLVSHSEKRLYEWICILNLQKNQRKPKVHFVHERWHWPANG